MDASLEKRKVLAQELGYSGDHDSAKMNMFLHKALMKKLAELVALSFGGMTGRAGGQSPPIKEKKEMQK